MQTRLFTGRRRPDIPHVLGEADHVKMAQKGDLVSIYEDVIITFEPTIAPLA